jgi:sec-independent protein translocase protein TatA
MGFSGIGIWELLIILAIVIMLFGTKRLKTLGSDLGSMIRGFKSSMSENADKEKNETPQSLENKTSNTASINTTEKSEHKQ